MFRRHPILTIVCLLTALVIAATAVFVATFDLNSYRQELQNTLSATLKRPVRLGEAHFSLKHGPSFDIRNLAIEATQTDRSRLQADHLYLRLELWPLLRGRIIFAKVTFKAPRVRIVLAERAESSSAEGAPHSADLSGLTDVRTLSIHNGELTVVDTRRPGPPLTMTLTHIDGRFDDQGRHRLWQVDIKGRLQQKEADAALSLAGTIALPAAPDHWREIGTHLLLTATGVAPAPLVARYAPATPPADAQGRMSLRVALDGVLASGMQISAELHGQKCTLELPSLYRQPLALGNLVVRGRWSATPEVLQGEKLDIQVNGLAFGGQLRLEKRSDGSWLSGVLDSDDLPLQSLIRLIPDAAFPQLAANLQTHVKGGTLRLKALHFAGPVGSFAAGWQDLPLTSGTLTLGNAGVDFGENLRLNGVGCSVVLDNGKLEIDKGNGQWGQTPLQFNASLPDLHQASPTLTAEIDAQPAAAQLLALLPKKSSQLKISGPLPVKVALNGPINRLAISLKADLAAVAADYAGEIHKAAGQAAALELTGEVSRAGLTLTAAALSLPPLVVQAKGSWTPGATTPFQITLDARGFNLKTARTAIPLLAKLESRGQLGLHAELAGDNGHLTQKRGTLTLDEVGLSLGKTLAPLHNLSGRIRFDDDRAGSIGMLHAVLGSSPLQVGVTVSRFASPKATLTLRAKRIKADELIFNSDTAVLHDLAGQLGISAAGIDFRHISVRLDGGTVAVVNGTLKNFHAPQVRLDITSKQADIGEVIALWHRSDKAPPLPEEEQDKVHTTLFISAHADRGSLYGMRFQDAQGDIVSSGHGVLAIYPLHFSAGEGRGTAQVLVDHTKGSPPLLRTSGRLDNFDATLLHRELLKSPGLISGKLSGDFYLEGRIGESYLDTSTGGFNVVVRNGVLREFPTLSKVFSILNVSQILTFHLPDMARDGMPFNKVSGTFSLRHGILSTEDLFVDSNAMNLSLVGKSDLRNGRLDYIMGVKPLRTVDKIVTNIPIAGWLLTGKEKALITAQFEIKGTDKKPDVSAIPITSVSDKVFGIFKRILGLPGHVISEAGSLLESKPEKK